MALAAVCPSCSTRFRVVADQLKLKNGWVRCGSCGFAFNAVERLSYVPDDTIVTRRSVLDELIANTKAGQEQEVAEPSPPQPAVQARATAPAEPAPAAVSTQAAAQMNETAATHAAQREDAAGLPWPELDQADEPAPTPVAARTEARPSPPAALPAPAPAPAPVNPLPAKPRARKTPPPDDDAYELHTIIELQPRTDADDFDASAGRPNPAEQLAAEFLERDAQAAQRAQRIARVATYGAVLAGVLLIGQLSITFRNEVAAAAPGARPMLEFACEQLGCTVQLPAHASKLSLESLQLAQMGGGDMYQATVLVKNLSTLTQRPPHLELTLTRVNGEILARRVFAPNEWLPAQPAANGLPPQGETVAQFALRVDNASLGSNALSGFGGALFYPTP
jgi:predicted Zn finger-like uncharacterized protein